MSFAFKEWALVCDALGTGTQSIILRKGGIAEGRAGFRWQHSDFLLLPTLFHEQGTKLKVAPGTPLPQPRTDGLLEVRLRAHVEWAEELQTVEVAHRLAPFHLWQDDVIEERFRYKDDLRISLAFVRIYKLETPFRFPELPKYGGCRSWIGIPDVPAETGFQPVLDDETHRLREREIREALSEPVVAGVT
jgi:hypothetical protein